MFVLLFLLFVVMTLLNFFLTKTKGHTGLSSCSKCTQEDEYLCNRTCFPFTTDMSPKRSHDNFVNRTQDDYHISNVILILSIHLH